MDTIELDSYEFIDSTDKSRKEIRRYLPGSSMAFANNKLFIGQVFSDFILVIDIETKLIVRRIYIPGGGEGAFSSSPNDEKVYFASNKSSQLFIIDTTSYEYQSLPYPRNGRGCLTVLAHPNNKTVYLGIQRDCSLVIYDNESGEFIKQILLSEYINGWPDDSTPHRLTLDPDEPLLYVGMFQSQKGIYYINTNENVVIGNIAFKPSPSNTHFRWVNPISQAIYKTYLLTVNQSNHEMCAINRQTKQQVFSLFLGGAPNGPTDIVVVDDTAIIAYPEKNGVIYIDLKKALPD